MQCLPTNPVLQKKDFTLHRWLHFPSFVSFRSFISKLSPSLQNIEMHSQRKIFRRVKICFPICPRHLRNYGGGNLLFGVVILPHECHWDQYISIRAHQRDSLGFARTFQRLVFLRDNLSSIGEYEIFA